MLHLKAFYPANDKVKLIDVHPVQPWVVYVSKLETLTIYNTLSQELLFELQCGSSDDDLMQDAALTKLAEKDPALLANPSTFGATASRGASGVVRAVKFLDLEVAHWEITCRHYISTGSSKPIPNSSDIDALQGQQLLLILGESKISLFDMLLRKSYDLSRAMMEGTTPTCMAVLYLGGPNAPSETCPSGAMRSPVLAVGCSDGIVRLILLSTMRLVGRLASNQKTAVNCIVVTPAQGTVTEQVIAMHQNGSMALYEPFTRSLVMADVKSPNCKQVITAHEKEAVGCVLMGGTEDVEVCHPVIATVALDQRVALWELSGMREMTRNKVDSKHGVVTSLAYNPRNYSESMSCNLLLGTDNGTILGVHPGTSQMRVMCQLASIIPSGHKRMPKIYTIMSHPLNPEVVVVGTNVGTVLLVTEVAPLPAVSLPLQNLALAHESPITVGGRKEGLTYFTAIGDAVWAVSCQPIQSSINGERTQVPAVAIKSKMPGGVMGALGRAVLTCSADGSYLAAVWPFSRTYVIYHRLNAAWEVAEQGSAVAVSWHAVGSTFAVLEVPPPTPIADVATKKKSTIFGTKTSKAPDPEAVRASLEASAKAMDAGTVLRIKKMVGSRSEIQGTIEVGSDTPAAIWGGGLLGVVYKRRAPVTALVEGEPPAVLQFFTWGGRSRVGGELAEPRDLAWDPSLRLCALAYSNQVLLFRVNPIFTPLATLPIAGVTSMQWHIRQLYLVSPTTVSLAFVAMEAAVEGTLVKDGTEYQVLELASSSVMSSRRGDQGTEALPPPLPRPPGNLVMMGPRDGNLWLVNSQAQPCMIPLTHPGLRTRCLAAMGDMLGAATLATQTMPVNLHDDVAIFITTMHGRLGAIASASLPGLSLPLHAEICMMVGQFKPALTSCKAMLAGGRGTAMAFRIYDGNNEMAELGGLTKGPEPLIAQLIKEKPAATAAPSPFANVHIGRMDTINWNRPLQFRSSKAVVDGGSTSQVTPMKHVAVGLALKLAEAAQAANQGDMARQVIMLLLKHKALLTGPQLSRLGRTMTEAGMRQQFSELLVPSAGSLGEESGALLSAVLSGDPVLLQERLKSTGSQALTATQATSFRLVNALDEQGAWNLELRQRALATTGTRSTNDLIHFVVGV